MNNSCTWSKNGVRHLAFGIVGLCLAFAVSGSVWAQAVAINPGVGPDGFPALESACTDGEVYDDGTFENGYSGNPAIVSLFQAEQLFTPGTYPGTYTRACVCLTQTGGATLDFDLEVREDNGGEPGALLGSVPVSLADIPGFPSARFYEVDLSQLGLNIDSGSVWIGPAWNPMAFPSRFVCADETPATPLHQGAVNFDSAGWSATESLFPAFRAQLIRALGGAVGQATFAVEKDFDDDNDAEVDVTLSCNTGLPLEQTQTISEGDPVNFVIGDFEPGTLDCEVTEDVPAGYTASYDDGTVSADSCSWEDLTGGPLQCTVTNSLEQVAVEVTKSWIDENPEFNTQYVANADWSCNNVAFGNSSGFLDFNGNPDTETFLVYPDWESGTTCSIIEVDLLESGVEVDDSECQGLIVLPGEGASCTIFNTRLYEGIPTLSQYGLGVLALLMLGVGLVGFRRFV